MLGVGGPALYAASMRQVVVMFVVILAPLFLFMNEQELLEHIAKNSKALNKDYKRLKATLYPGKRKPKKRKIKRKKDAKEVF